jgi:hypothetical protein
MGKFMLLKVFYGNGFVCDKWDLTALITIFFLKKKHLEIKSYLQKLLYTDPSCCILWRLLAESLIRFFPDCAAASASCARCSVNLDLTNSQVHFRKLCLFYYRISDRSVLLQEMLYSFVRNFVLKQFQYYEFSFHC